MNSGNENKMKRGQQKQIDQIELLLQQEQKFTTKQQKILYENGYLKGLLSMLAAEYFVVEKEIKKRIND